MQIKITAAYLDNMRRLYGKNSIAVKEQEKELKNWQDSLSDANSHIPKLLSLLTNFYDLSTKEGRHQLAAEFALDAEQARILEERLKKLYETQNKGGKTPEPKSNPNHKPIALPVKPVIPEDFKVSFEEELSDMDFPQPVNVNAFEEQLRHELELTKLFYETGLIDEQEYQDRKVALLQEGYEQFAQWEGAKNEKALQYLSERERAEKEFRDKQKQLAQQQLADFSQIMGQMASAFQGTSKTMFEIGKAAAVAQSIINTYQAATKALAEFAPPLNYVAAAMVTAAGMANVIKIERTKFEKKKEGGPLLATQRVIATGDYGDGENLIFIANEKEYLIRSGPAQKYASLLDAINADRPPSEVAQMAMLINNAAAPKMQTGGAILDNIINPNLDQTSNQQFPMQVNAQIDPRSIESLKESIQNIKIEINGVLDSMQFFRDHFGEYQRIEKQRTVIE